ncbi:MAG: metalloregulator ArsR/SmtB family transcription factor [Robiginitomaculum sp.]|nr:winged helix-turn-helix transcriptional regulator [Robiginitomaculum sp.]MCF6293967.1 metalloregulator ArsR/SmtB family transcription factor [Robiginitomaculum sp.]
MRNTALQDIEQNVDQASALLQAMSNPKRLLVLCILAEDEQSVGALAKQVGLSQSALSQHLARLRDDGFVSTRREAQTVYYSVSGTEVKAVLGALHGIYCS